MYAFLTLTVYLCRTATLVWSLRFLVIVKHVYTPPNHSKACIIQMEKIKPTSPENISLNFYVHFYSLETKFLADVGSIKL